MFFENHEARAMASNTTTIKLVKPSQILLAMNIIMCAQTSAVLEFTRELLQCRNCDGLINGANMNCDYQGIMIVHRENLAIPG